MGIVGPKRATFSTPTGTRGPLPHQHLTGGRSPGGDRGGGGGGGLLPFQHLFDCDGGPGAGMTEGGLGRFCPPGPFSVGSGGGGVTIFFRKVIFAAPNFFRASSSTNVLLFQGGCCSRKYYSVTDPPGGLDS